MGPEAGEAGIENPLESKNLAFFSTLCTAGSGTGVVIQTGKRTFMGRIADLASTAEGVVLTLEHEIDKFIKIISIIAITFGVVFFCGGFGQNFPVITNLVFALGMIVANVPEGLLSCLTLALALTAQRLFQKNVMVKNMKSVETLGCITCICSDKTGTLTQNRMTVVHLWYDFNFKRTRKDQENIIIDNKPLEMEDIDQQEPSFEIFKFAALCGSGSRFRTETPDDYLDLIKERNKFIKSNPKADSSKISDKVAELKKKFQAKYDIFYQSNINDRITDGDASEAGIIKFFEHMDNIQKTRNNYPQVRCNNEDIKIPFNSKDKVAGFLRENPSGSGGSYYWLAFKGAPEYIVKRCATYLINGKEIPMDANFKREFDKANQAFALKGERVIALAYLRLDEREFPKGFNFKNDINPSSSKDPNEIKEPNYPTTNLCFVGLVAMEDPPR